MDATWVEWEELGARWEAGLSRLANSTGLGSSHVVDYALAMVIGAVFPLGRWVMDKLVYEPIGRRALGIKGVPTLDQQLLLRKYKESFYKVGVQLTFTCVLAFVALRAPWSRDTKQLWSECSGLPCEAPISLGERFVYCLELGFYTQAVPMLFLWEVKRKDRLEVFAHHVATIVLITYSYWLNLTRVGVMVLVCHEANDIFMEAAKMSRYAGRETMATTWFVVFFLSWVATRVLAFPLIVIRSTWWESQARADELEVGIQPHHAILNGFLGFLYVLHVYWSYLILRIIWQALTGGRLEDVREGEEEEVQDEHQGSKRDSVRGAKGACAEDGDVHFQINGNAASDVVATVRRRPQRY